jgi:hypothetical protein
MRWGVHSGILAAALLIGANPFDSAAVGQPSDVILSTAVANCDRTAEQETAAASARKSIAPTDLLAWPLLLPARG